MPLGLLALGSWLEGRHVVIVDGRFELAPEARVVELARSALLLWVSARTGEPLREALRVSRAARAASPSLTVIWSGPHVLVDPESCLASGVVDACAPGAGEEPLQAAVAALRSGRPLASVPGLQVPGGGRGRRPRRRRRSCGRAPTTRCSTWSATSRSAARAVSTTARAAARARRPTGSACAPSAWWARWSSSASATG